MEDRVNFINHLFVCNKCKRDCANHKNCIAHEEHKFELDCLGKYCDEPCELQLDKEPDMAVVIEALHYIVKRCNEELIKEC